MKVNIPVVMEILNIMREAYIRSEGIDKTFSMQYMPTKYPTNSNSVGINKWIHKIDLNNSHKPWLSPFPISIDKKRAFPFEITVLIKDIITNTEPIRLNIP